MGEIPPLPPLMQPELPVEGKAINVQIDAAKSGSIIRTTTNLPDGCTLYVAHNKAKAPINCKVENRAIEIKDANSITKIEIDSIVRVDDSAIVSDKIGKKCRNLSGPHIVYHPIYGNTVRYVWTF